MPRRKVPDSARVRCLKACVNCKRRKERCDGLFPCRGCLRRDAGASCHFEDRIRSPRMRQFTRASSSEPEDSGVQASVRDAQDSTISKDQTEVFAPTNPTTVPPVSRLVKDVKGKMMFIGDSANLCFLQNVRKLVRQSVGSCDLVDDPLRDLIVEAIPEGTASWINSDASRPPPTPSASEAGYLIHRCFLATNCVMDLFDETELLQNLGPWLQDPSAYNDSLSPIYYLVFALGAQTSPEDKEETASAFFDYGRYLTASFFLENPSILTVQCYAMVTMYMLGSSRRNAAFMTLGIAVRAAYALGLHSLEISSLFPPAELRTRERPWKVIRILDLFMSASLGRPPSTSETRDTRAETDYSASADLCSIFETILMDVYSKRKVSTDVLQRVSEHHRTWTVRFSQGLKVDCIQPAEVLEEEQLPNIGLIHVKEAYYWTIILLTRPFLLEMVSLHISRTTSDRASTLTPIKELPNQVLVHACIEAAIRTIDLVKVLLDYDRVPKRLPFVINSVFVSALTLGLAYFGDMHKTFPLKSNLELARRLLAHFPHDAIARRTSNIVEYLQRSCNSYDEKHSWNNLRHFGHSVEGLFGQIHKSKADTLGGQESSYSERSHLSGSATGQNSGETEYKETAEANGTSPADMLPSHMAAHLVQSANESGISASASNLASRDTWADGINGAELSTLLMAPQTLWFESFDESSPLFSTMPQFDMNSFLE